jgi:ssRNA-specific RNase YbeY (16S rRNA maturation enzyme)
MSSPEGSSVTFRRVPPTLRRAPIQRFAGTLQKEVVKNRSFDILITGDAELRRLNRDSAVRITHRCPLLPSHGGTGFSCQRPLAGACFLGDIAISLARAAPKRVNSATPSSRKSQILMLHGVL